MQADPRLKTVDRGWSALHFAADQDHDKVAQLLLAKGRANVDARDVDGFTPLHIATRGKHRRVSEVLLRFGARMQAKADDGETPEAAAKADQEFQALFSGAAEQRAKHRERVFYDVKPDLVAAKLVLTPDGYFPEYDGEVKILNKPVKINRKHRGPRRGGQLPNWYCPRG